MTLIIILSISALLQFSASFFAFRLIKVTGKTFSWIFISAALCLMGIRRLMHLLKLTVMPGMSASGYEYELIGLILSLFFFIGIMGVRPLLYSRIRLEDEIRKSEIRFRTTLDNMLEGCQIIGTDWRYIYLNDAAARHSRLSKQELIGNVYMDIWPGAGKTEVFKIIRLCMEEKVYRHMENEFIFPDGTSGWFELSIHPVPEGVFILSIDITDRKQTEEELRFALMRMRSFADADIAGMIIASADGNIIEANDYYLNMTGYSREDFYLGLVDWRKITPPEWISADEKAIAELREKGICEPYEKEYLKSDGSRIWIYIADALLPGPEEQIAAFVLDITSRKYAEEALQKVSRQLKLFIEHAPAAIAMFDTEMKYIAVSNRFLSDYHLGEADITGKSHYEVFPEIPVQIKEVHRRCLEGAIEKSGEDSFPRKDGTVDWVRWEVHPWFEYKDKIGGILLFSEVITDRKLAEESLRLSEEKFSVLFSKSSLPAVLSSIPDHAFVEANEAWLELFGFSREEVIGKTSVELGINRDVNARKLVLDEIHKKNIIRNIERVVYTKSGTPLTILANIDTVTIGKEKFALHTLNDITERKKIEEELKTYRDNLEDLVKVRTKELDRSRNLLRTLIDTLPDEIYAKDMESRFILANYRMLRTYGLSGFNEILGKTDFDLLSEDQALKAYKKDHSVLSNKGNIVNYEEKVFNEDGSARWILITKVPVKDSEGNITGLVGTNRDITYLKESEENLKKAKEEAETASMAKSTFLSNMSHEIRTPMNAILGFSEILQGAENLTQEQNEWLGTIQKSGSHLLTLINDILEISRIEAGRVTYNPSSFNILSLLKDIETMFRIKTDKNGVVLLFEYPEIIKGNYITDESKFKQIIINLVGNAVKFTKEGSVSVTISSEQTESKVLLSIKVEDTGPGIAKKDIGKLFQKFGQAEAGIKEEGTGLGLVISRQYANLMGGDITVTSEEGRGACFTFTVPVEKDKNVLISGDNITSRKVAGLQSGQKSPRILVVDDRQDNRNLLKTILGSVDIVTFEAQNGVEAIEKYKNESPDLILLDMRMPVMNGYEVIQKIKTMKGKRIPVIAVTAGAFQEDIQRIKEMGADGYICKPFRENELFEVLASTLGIKYIYK
ncbi:MAG: PAS domain S-box protein [Spirochaetes bacterium]|nr:PAS domain S-box protein [Spirochaetota bacterium]